MTTYLDDPLSAALLDGISGADSERLRAALRAVLIEHAPERRRAGVMAERYGAGKCAYCGEGPPTRQFRDYLNGSASKVPMHEHGHYNWCGTCRWSDDGEPPWPCPTLAAVGAALGVSLEAVTP